MPRLVLPQYTVVRDTREKTNKGWLFSDNTNHKKKRPPLCKGTTIETLKTGDYSVKGYEDIISVERKADFAELWDNYQNRDRFEDEMQRMSLIKYKMIVIESYLTSEIFNLSPPQFKSGVPGKALTRWLMNLSSKYGVPIMPIGPCGKHIVQQFMEEIIRIEKGRWEKQE